MFFDFLHAPKITAKQLKLRDLVGDLTLMPKSISEKRVCSMHKNNSSIYTSYKGLFIG